MAGRCDITPATPQIDNAELERRLDAVREAYFESERDRQCCALLDRVLDRIAEIERRRAAGTLKVVEGRAEIIIGESGAGKTTLINRALRIHAGFTGFLPGHYPESNKCPWALSVTIRAPSTTAHFGVELLNTAWYPMVPRRPDARVILPLARAHLKSLGVKVIVIDEVHALTRTKNAVEIAKIQDLFRSLLNDAAHPVQLIFVGTEAALVGLNDDDGQLLRRSNIMRLEAMKVDDQGKAVRIIRKLAAAATIEMTDPRPDRLAARLIHACRGRLGLMAEMTVFAIEEALRTGSGLGSEAFAIVFARQKGVSANLNPFVADDFRNIEIRDLFGEVATQPARSRAAKR
jgi:hypothetical protein